VDFNTYRMVHFVVQSGLTYDVYPTFSTTNMLWDPQRDEIVLAGCAPSVAAACALNRYSPFVSRQGDAPLEDGVSVDLSGSPFVEFLGG